MVNIITIFKTASGYHGVIAGQNYGLKEPDTFLEIAKNLFPHLSFKIVIK